MTLTQVRGLVRDPGQRWGPGEPAPQNPSGAGMALLCQKPKNHMHTALLKTPHWNLARH